MKRSFKSHTTLIELTVALLFFLLASALIVQLFTLAYGSARGARQEARALSCAQDCAEIIAGGDDPLALLEAQGYTQENGVYTRVEDEISVRVETRIEESGAGRLLWASITACSEGEETVTLSAARYLPAALGREAP